MEKKPLSPFIVNPAYDYICFIFCPLIAFLLGYLVTLKINPGSSQWLSFAEESRKTFHHIFYTPFIFAHLVLVFFRSHLNKKIFQLYPFRFAVVPVALLFAMLLSNWVLAFCGMIAIWWDVYHSSLQTFGLARIYDRKKDNDPNVGRRLDYWLNIVIYAGPILAGVNFIQHVLFSTQELGLVQTALSTEAPVFIASGKKYISWVTICIGCLYLVYYVMAYWDLHRKGYYVSFQKVLLLISTAICTLFAWGFNSFGEGFFIVNFFHAFQYFALVWWSEKNNMVKLMRTNKMALGKVITFVLMIGLTFGYGFWADKANTGEYGKQAMAITLVVSLMHFWYDGFIWSVRKKQI